MAPYSPEETNIERVKLGGKNLEESTVGLSDSLFNSLRPGVAAAAMALLFIPLGLLVSLAPNDVPLGFTAGSLGRHVLVYGLLLGFIPTVVSAAAAPPLVKAQGEIMWARRSFTMALISQGIIIMVLLFGRLFEFFYPYDPMYTLLFAFAATTVGWYTVSVSMIFGHRVKAIPVTIIHCVTGYILIALMAWYGLFELAQKHLILMVIYPTTFLIGAAVWFEIGQQVWRTMLNTKGLGVLRFAIMEFLELGSGKRGLEPWLDSLGRPMDMKVACVLFTCDRPRRGGGEGRGGHKLAMAVCDAHPGPFGLTGGSNLPAVLASELKPGIGRTMLFHGASTHDENPTSEPEVVKLLDGFKKTIRDIERGGGGGGDGGPNGPFTRVHRDFDVCAQPLGGGLVVVHTSSPAPTDDVEPAVGRRLGRKVRAEGWTPLFFDAHNCLKKGAGGVYDGSERAAGIVKMGAILAKRARSKVNGKSSSGGLRVGYAERRGFDLKRDGIGPMGVQLAAVEFGKMVTGYLLFDGNNMVTGLRERLRDEMLSRGFDEAEVFTTDNHLVNTRAGGYNPVGSDPRAADLVPVVGGLCAEARRDLEPCTARAGEGKVRGVQVFGKGTSVRLSMTIHKCIGRMGRTLIPFIAVVTSICATATFFI